MDEDWFAIPGWTVAQEGVPRVPYAPERHPESVFYWADVALYALPPAYFYWQAPLHWLLPPGCGTSRLASAIAGVVALLIVARLGQCAYGDGTIGVVAAGILVTLASVLLSRDDGPSRHAVHDVPAGGGGGVGPLA